MKVKEKTISLKNGRVINLRSPTSDDAENLLQHLRITHAESYKNLNQSAEYWNGFSIAEEEKILADFESSKTKFMMTAFADKKIIGGLGFVGSHVEFLKNNASIGMSIQQSFCQIGLGTEMMKYALVLGRGFGFHRVDLTVRSYNTAGIALYEKVGFQRVGLLKDIAFVDGKYVDEYSYQIILN